MTANPRHEAHPCQSTQESRVGRQISRVNAQRRFKQKVDKFKVSRREDVGTCVLVMLIMKALVHVRRLVAGDVPGPDLC